MKKLYLLFVVFIISFAFTKNVGAQSISNAGTDFWAVFPTHDPSGTNLAKMNIFVTSASESEVTVSCGSYSLKATIPANTAVPFEIPRPNSYVDYAQRNTVLTNRGIHIVVTQGKPKVSVYAHMFAGARSAASLILPFDALGQKYYSMNYTQDVSIVNTIPARNYLVLVAVEDNTKLIITEKNGNKIPITLALKGDVYEHVPNSTEDLTGTLVEVDPVTSTCKRFAAFSGSTSNTVVCTNGRDPLFQQLYTITSWGKNYGIVPFINRRYVLRVLAQEDNTKIKIGNITVIKNKGEFYESSLTSPLTQATFVSADKLISVAQYSLSVTCSSITGGALTNGDPDMVLLNPVEFNIKNITVFSSDKEVIRERYINVFMKTAKRNSFKLNGAVPNGTWQTLAENPDYSFIQITVSQESLTLTADDGFNAIACGFGNVESYAYSAGTSLASNQYLTLVDKLTNEESSSACINENADFKMTLPYKLTKIVWKFGDNTPDFIDSNPQPEQTIVNGETLYTYSAAVNKSFSTIGQKTVTATGTLETSTNSCSGSEADFIFNFNVDPLPKAAFSAPSEVCADTEISFTDQSLTNVTDKKIIKWIWDFGDNTPTSDLQNPKHSYTASGTYQIKLFVFADNGCASEVEMKPILISPKLNPLYAVNKKNCVTQDITFTDQSTVDLGGTITKWIWDMGDGTAPLIKTDSQPFTYKYTTIGEKTVTLTLESDKLCKSKVFSDKFMVYELPKVDFAVPDFCLSDGAAIFTNKTTIADGTESGFTYLWNFGDPQANAQRPNTSTLKNASHAYTRTGNYTVTLTVISNNGCSVTSTKQFTVNGSVPMASFKVLNENALCSNKPLQIEDHSTVDFGEITKIEWYLDDENQRLIPDFTDENPNLRSAPSKVYSFNLQRFSSPENQPFKIRMVVYSGGSCYSETIKDIVVLATPAVDFTVPQSPACLTNGMANFTNLSTIDGNNQLTYTWNFGDQYATVQNNTSTAKDGTHHYTKAGTYTVRLTVNAANTCEAYTEHTIDVAGSVPVPKFEIPASVTFCSNKEVVFNELSTTDFGEITKIEWYYDSEHEYTVSESWTIANGPRPLTYKHLFPPLTGPEPKKYVVKMIAYSGNCSQSFLETIYIKPIPEIIFEQPNEVCREITQVQLVASEKNNEPGTGTFSGSGVTASGLFNPKQAGSGKHIITYTFVTTNGCSVQKSQTITVNETPMVDLGIDRFVLLGGETTFNPIVLGDKLTYKWTPSKGLDRDDILNATASPTESTTYTLTVKTDKGCVSSDQVFVKVLEAPIVPNSFTPNGDGINDVWNIKYLESYPKATVEIFNRAGEKVYFGNGFNPLFDGNLKGQALPVGTYYYIINPNSGRKTITGNLTIIR